MTDIDKRESLVFALQENGWTMTGIYKSDSKRKVFFGAQICFKNGVKMTIEYYPELEEMLLYIKINGKEYSSVEFREVEVFSDHLEFMHKGVSFMVRFSDAYVLMEYEPKEESKMMGDMNIDGPVSSGIPAKGGR